jgi:hypothetical protein
MPLQPMQKKFSAPYLILFFLALVYCQLINDVPLTRRCIDNEALPVHDYRLNHATYLMALPILGI